MRHRQVIPLPCVPGHELAVLGDQAPLFLAAGQRAAASRVDEIRHDLRHQRFPLGASACMGVAVLRDSVGPCIWLY